MVGDHMIVTYPTMSYFIISMPYPQHGQHKLYLVRYHVLHAVCPTHHHLLYRYWLFRDVEGIPICGRRGIQNEP